MMTKQTCERCDALRAENERLISQLQSWDPHWALRKALPTPDEAVALFEKITNKFPRMKSASDAISDGAAGMVAAMAYCYSVTKRATPESRYGGDWWVSRASEFANGARIFCPRIRSLLVGIVATNDIDFALSNSDIWLNPFGGTGGAAIDRMQWRKLLDGAPLREPIVIEPKFKDFGIGGVKMQGVNAW
jgi:hypothetical protein